MTLPILYKKAKTGKVTQCLIYTDGATVVTETGYVGGVQTKHTYEALPKNIGRSNATTAEQQAVVEAQAKWDKNLKSKYVEDPSGETSQRLPMKVKSYQDQLHNVKFPCFSSAKLNGVNAIYRRDNSELTIYSRGGEVYPVIPHLEQLVHEAMDLFNSNELNGELYIHGKYLQDIQSAVTKPNDLSPKLSFCIFDIADSKQQFYERATLMHKHSNFDTTLHSTVSVVHNVICIGTNAIELHFEECTQFGYEGTVIKNTDALYEHNVRSSNMFKYKKAQSAEFLIESYNLDKNNLPVFVMQCDAGTFKAKPVGTKEFWLAFNPTDYLGKYATIEYETLSKDGIPLKPIFISLRSMDSAGNPKE